MCFVQLRQQTETIQGVVSITSGGADGKEEEDGRLVSKQMVKYITSIPVSMKMSTLMGWRKSGTSSRIEGV